MPKKVQWFYHVYRVTGSQFIVLCQEPVKGDVRVVHVEAGKKTVELSLMQKFPDLRRLYPFPWLSLGPATRAEIRALMGDGCEQEVFWEFGGSSGIQELEQAIEDLV
jgi:hypothetical protein